MDSTKLPIFCIRNVTDPLQKEMGIAHYIGKTQVKNVIPFSTRDNLREYLAEYDPKKRTKVHKDIETTLREYPELFSTYNAGVTICAQQAEGISSNSNTLELLGASIINGAQTRGVINHVTREKQETYECAREAGEDTEDPNIEAYVTFELFLIPDPDISANTAIYRNNQNAVAPLSIVFKRGSLKQLAKCFGKDKIRLKQSDPTNNGMIDTEKLMQVLTALTPSSLWFRKRDKEGSPTKNISYSNKQKCLLDFEEVFKARHNVSHQHHDQCRELYKFYLDIATSAWELYKHWKSHQGFGHKRYDWIKRGEKRVVIELPDAIIFPIISAMSHLCKKVDGKWTLQKHPRQESLEADLVDNVCWFYSNSARSKMHQVGRMQTSYNFMDVKMRPWAL